MLADLAALTPPLVVCAAFLIGLLLFLRRQMGPSESADDSDGGDGGRDRESPRGAVEDSRAGADAARD